MARILDYHQLPEILGVVAGSSIVWVAPRVVKRTALVHKQINYLLRTINIHKEPFALSKVCIKSLDPKSGVRIMPDNLPGGSMVKRVRHNVLPRLKSDAGLPFFFPLLNLFPEPLI